MNLNGKVVNPALTAALFVLLAAVAMAGVSTDFASKGTSLTDPAKLVTGLVADDVSKPDRDNDKAVPASLQTRVLPQVSYSAPPGNPAPVLYRAFLAKQARAPPPA